MRRRSAGILALLAVFVPASMLTLAVLYDRRTVRSSGCYGYWSEGQQSVYDVLVGGSPFVAAGLAFASIVATDRRWRYPLAVAVGMCAFAVLGISALVLVYYECA